MQTDSLIRIKIMETLEFTMQLTDKPVPQLQTGLLKYKGMLGSNEFQATSGLSGIQYKGSQKCKGTGVIPDCHFVGIKEYHVSTNKLWLPNVRGVEGSFFPISPFEVNASGVQRGDFGIHFDANVPGSSGCIVLRTQYGWTKFLQLMQQIKDAGNKYVSLLVDYT